MRFADINRNPTPRTLRQFAALWIVFFGAMAVWKASYILAILALSAGLIGLVRPGTLRAVYVGWMIMAFPLGWLISRLMLAVLYFVVFLPLGMLFRLTGRDALILRKPACESYWNEKPAAEEVSDYFRQY